jgi:hypothetical protein
VGLAWPFPLTQSFGRRAWVDGAPQAASSAPHRRAAMQSAASTRAARCAAPSAGARGAARTTVSGVTAPRAPLRRRVAARAEPDAAPAAADAAPYADEAVFYEGSGSPAELALSM